MFQWFFLSFDLPEEFQSKNILEFGIHINSSFLTERNVSDIGVYFKDGANYEDIFSPLYRISGPRLVDNIETVYTLKAAVTEKLAEVDGCAEYGKR